MFYADYCIDVCDKYSMENEITHNVMLLRLFACTFGQTPKHMYRDEYKYLGCYITSGFIDDRDLKCRARAIYSRGNMMVRKFSDHLVNVKN